MANSDCERSSSFTPIYQVMFVLQERALDRTRELGGVSVVFLILLFPFRLENNDTSNDYQAFDWHGILLSCG